MKYYHAVYFVRLENGATQITTANVFVKNKLTAKVIAKLEGDTICQCRGAKSAMLLNLIRISPTKREGK